MRIGYNKEKTAEYADNFGAVILAAGFSSRMGAFKPLLPVDGRTALEGLIETARTAGIEDITVVTGYNREAVAPVIRKYEVREAYNEEYEQGMFTSIKRGLAFAREKAMAAGTAKKGYLLMPVDSPLISVRVMRMVMDEVSDTIGAESNFAVATFEGKKGHPLYIPGRFIDEICRFEGAGGLGGVTDMHQDGMIRIETCEEGCVLDMDTPEAYEDMKKFVAKGFAREKLELLTARKRIFLVRHGQTRQHDEPMFIGRYDVPLNDEGRDQAAKAGERIAEIMAEDIEAELLGMDKFGKEPMPTIERIYCSNLVRAEETADIIRSKVNEKILQMLTAKKAASAENPSGNAEGYPEADADEAGSASGRPEVKLKPVEVKSFEGLAEINLGSWDGRPVREIREQHPEEYDRRGKNFFAYKRRDGSENFYDMQYRVLETLRAILAKDDAKDIIIVTHSGVIRALENNILGKHVDDDWEPLGKGEFRMLEPFPVQPSEKINAEKPMSMNDMIMESTLEYYE